MAKTRRAAAALSRKRKKLRLIGAAAVAHEHLQAGHLKQAEKICQAALEVSPDRHSFSYLLARVVLERGRPAFAVPLLEQAVNLSPRVAEYHFWLGEAHCRERNFSPAVGCFERAVALCPFYAEAHNSLGVAYQAEGRIEDAIAAFQAAIQHDPALAAPHNNLGGIYRDQNRAEKAIACFNRALKLDPYLADAHWHVSHIRKDPTPDKEIVEMERLLERPDLPDRAAIQVHYALGWSFDRRDELDSAFHHLTEAKRLQKSVAGFDRDRHVALVDRVITSFSPEWLADHSAIGNDSELPVFVVGMPRSGTTLVEQIVSSHPDVHGAGELRHMRQIEESLPARASSHQPYPECVASLDDGLAKTLAGDYLSALRPESVNTRRISDKMRSNFLRLGLIHALFPRARIVHCFRDPRDTCLSIFFQNFNNGHTYSYDLGNLGSYYRQYQRIMHHWREQLPHSLLDVQYEDLVEDQTGVSKRIVAFLGLQWDDRCLAFHENQRAMKTASRWQVRQPIYKKSVGRWQRYEKHLDDLMATLSLPPGAGRNTEPATGGARACHAVP